ncbi:MAG: nucleotidyltransferase family protein [Butyrivibrio sp.]|nr:nucleotidyltransferase family protein [Butyrivibrio sp.]
MKAEDRYFIELTRRAINRIHEDDGFFDAADWKRIFELARKNGLDAVLLDSAKECGKIPEDVLKIWEAARFETFMRQGVHFKKLMDILREMSSAGIDYAVFKGPAIAACYPNSLYRFSSDSDILVDASDRPKVSAMIEKRGYVVKEHETKEKVFVYEHEASGHKIELHTSVFEDYEGAKIDILKGAEIDSPAHRIKIKTEGGEIRTFGVSEHLVYLVFHMIKHFVLEGANVRFFADITVFINNNIDQIDKKYFWGWMEKCNYTVFCENFLTICVKYLGLNKDILEGRIAKASESVLEDLLVDFIYCGDSDELRGKSWQLTATLQPYLVGERTKVKKSKRGRLISYIFPEADELNERYTYAKKHHALLPIAWVHRALHKFLWQLREREEENYTGMQKVEVVESRLGLLGSVGLLDEE